MCINQEKMLTFSSFTLGRQHRCRDPLQFDCGENCYGLGGVYFTG